MSEDPAPVHPKGLDRVVLAGEALTRLNPLLDADRAQAVADLEFENQFRLCGTSERAAAPGPYVLHLSVQEGRLVFDVRDAADEPAVFAHYDLPYTTGSAGERRLARR